MPKSPRKPGLEQLEKAASRLRPIEQEVLFLCAQEGLSYDVIAQRLGISSDEVKERLADALYHLDRELERQARPLVAILVTGRPFREERGRCPGWSRMTAPGRRSMRKSSPPPRSPAETITLAIIERLEAGTRPWIRPWSAAGASRPLRACGTPYQGINTLWLWMAAEAAGHGSSFWLTYRQAQLLGGQVRKGERGTLAIFYKAYSKEVEDRDTGLVQDEARRVLKSFIVFNACQIDGLPERFFPAPRPLPEPTERDLALDMFFTRIPAQLRHHGSEAYYDPVADRITMPDRSVFEDCDHYRATLAHELSHWTGHGSRLARSLAGRFGSDAYAVEELIAELAAAMLGAELGLPVAHLDHHASYLASWLKVLKSDSRAILTAAAKAEEACKLLLRLGGRSDEAADEPEDAQRLAA